MPPLNKFSKSCLTVAMGHTLGAAPLHAANITVTNTGDSFGSCTLRDAITSVNTAGNTGNCVAVGPFGTDQIRFDLPQPSTISLVSGPLEITTVFLDIIVTPKGSVEIDASGVSSAFNITNSSAVLIDGLAITQGNIVAANSGAIEVRNSKISGNVTSGFGGGVFLNNCNQCKIRDSEISNNTAYSGAGAAILDSGGVSINDTTISNNTATGEGAAGRGGGISFVTYAANGTTHELFIRRSTITGNSTTGLNASGGGIASYSNGFGSSDTLNVSISDSKIISNEARSVGGGIRFRSQDSQNVIMTTTISNNSARNGGGIHQGGSSNVSIDQTTLSRNSARNSGGAIYGTGLSISNSTISGNSSPFNGSAITSYAGYGNDINISSSTITGNMGQSGLGIITGSFNQYTSNINLLANNVISDHSSGNCDEAGLEFVDPYNWLDDDSCGVVNSGDPKLGELADNGGPTFTHAPLPGSGLAGAGLVSACNSEPIDGIDQRGIARGSTSCFIGAVEGIIDPSSFFVVPLPNGKSVTFSL